MSAFKKNIIKNLIIAELIVFVPKIIVLLQAIPFADIRDELAMLAVPAHLAGCDWSGCMISASYYGFGFFVIFTPLFWMNMDIVWIYRIILFATAVLEGVIPVIIQYILYHYFNITSSRKVIIITIVGSFITINPLYNLVNEHILAIIVWMITLIAIKLVYADTKKNRQINTFLLVFFLLYGLFIHTRFSVVIIAICLAVPIYRFVYKKWLISPIWAVILGVGYIISKFIIQIVQKAVWGGTDLINASVSFPKIGNVSLLQLCFGFLKVMLGNLGTFIIYSAASGIFVIGASMCFLFQFGIKGKRSGNKEKAIFFVLCIFLLSAGGVLTAMGLQNMKSFAVLTEGEKIYAIKILTYLRYYLVFLIPVFFVGMILFFEYTYLYKGTYIISFFFMIGILVLWINIIAPDVSNTYYGMSPFYPFSYLLHVGAGLNIDDFRAIVVIIINIALLFIMISKRNKLNVGLCLACLFVYQYLYFAIEIAIPQEKQHYSWIEKSIEFVENCQDEEKVIYVYDKLETLPFLYQGYLYQYKIELGIPKEFDDNIIVLSNENIDALIPEKLGRKCLSEHEWLYYGASFPE